VLYPRDPSLDPQLVWKGKDEQDARPRGAGPADLHPGEDRPAGARREPAPTAKASEPEPELTCSTTSTASTTTKVDFYHTSQLVEPHDPRRLAAGDDLLAEKEGLRGKVQMIYIDPPYGIKFGSNWQVSTRKRDVKDGKAEDATRQPSRSRPSATPGSSASTPTSPTCATASSWRATC
jgi:adenine-specific DNA-methyltransferase